MGKLYVVATPIGNLEDISSRAKKTLSEVDFVLSEDTRVGQKLLSLLSLKVPTMSYHQHSPLEVSLKILKLLQEGSNIALITDAGTPGISDPGGELIEFLVEADSSIQIVPIPGPSALTSILSVSGFDVQHFTFLGFFPKKKQNKFIESFKELGHPVVFFDSPHRVKRNLKKLSELLHPQTKVIVGRELTKVHETIYRGSLTDVLDQVSNDVNLKGELVVVLNLQKKTPS